MNVLSLFDGMSCGQIALNRAGIKYDKYFASEVDKYAIKVTMANYPNTIQLGDVTKYDEWDLPNIDLLLGGSPCFVAGTKILTNTGLKNIEDVREGDYVLTHKNNWHKVIKIGNQKAKIIMIKASGVLPTGTTPDHPYYSRSMNRVWDNENRTSIRSFSTPEWKKAGELKKNEFLSIPRIKDSQNIFNLSDDECFIIGRYIADGHTRKDYRIEKGRENDRHWQLILSIGNNKTFSTDMPHSLYNHTKNVQRMVFSNKRLVQIAELECGIGSFNKEISLNLLKLPIDKLKILIDGILSGDGSYRNNCYRVTTISRKLVDSLSLAIAKVYGVATCIELTKRPKTTIIEGRVVNQHDTYTISFYKEIKKQSNFYTDEDHVWVRFKETVSTNKTETVYNLEVEKDNSYIANNAVVHNCQGFSFAGKQLNFDDERSKLFFKYVEILEKYKPKYFLLENVRMKKESQDIISKYLGVEPIEINSALVSAQNRKRLYWTNIEGIEQPEDKNIYLKDIIENGLVDRDKSYCVDANYFKRGSLKSNFLNSRRQLVFEKPHGWNKGGIKEKEKFGTLRECTSGNYAIYDHRCYQIAEADINGYDCVKRVYSTSGKSPTLTTCTGGNREPKILFDIGKWRKLTPIECERLQTVGDNYTNYVSNSQRYKMLGNGWTVDVISHILSYIK